MICDTDKISELFLHEAIAEDTERRRLHRKPFLRRATIMQIEGRTVVDPAFCRDISRDGIGLLHGKPIEAGSNYTLAIPILGRVLEIQCEANWCNQVGERQYFSGAAYHYRTSPQSLVLLSVALSQDLNRRLHLRYPFVRPVTLKTADGHSQSGFSRDISRLGIGLIHREPLMPGRVVVTLPSHEHGEIEATADIRRCPYLGQGWYASGGRFPVEEIEDVEGSEE